MKISHWLAAIMFCLGSGVMGIAHAQTNIADLYGRAAGVGSPQLSPSGKHLAVSCAPQGTPSLCVFDLTGAKESALLGLDSTYRLRGFDWASDETLVFKFSTFERIKTQSGMREYEVSRAVAYNTEDGKSTMLMSDNRATLNTSNIVSYLPQDDKNVLILGWYRSNKSQMDRIAPAKDEDAWQLRAYKSNVKTGRTRAGKLFSKQTDEIIFNREGAAVARLTRNTTLRNAKIWSGTKEIYRVDNIDIMDMSLVALDESANRLMVFVERGADFGLNYMSLETGELSPVLINGERAGGAAPIIDERTRTLVGVSYAGPFDTQHFLVPELAKAKAAVEMAMKGKHVTVTSWTDDRSKVAVSVEAPGRPADYFVYDISAGTMGVVGSAASHLADRPLGSVTAIEYQAGDGLTIPGFLTLPTGKTRADGPFPLIVLPHGGPTAYDNAIFDWWSQAYAEAGFAVLQPNFRGSDGYSTAFRLAGDGEYGGKMIDDIIDGAAWARAQGVSEGKYCVAGGSYGGYAALMTAARDVENVACAISVNGVTDPILRLSEFEARGDTYNYYERMLGVGRFDAAQSLDAIKPVSQVTATKAPVLVLHGREDTRVPFRQFELLKSSAGGRLNYSFVELEGEDHFLQSSFARNRVLNETLGFLETNLSVKQ